MEQIQEANKIIDETHDFLMKFLSKKPDRGDVVTVSVLTLLSDILGGIHNGIHKHSKNDTHISTNEVLTIQVDVVRSTLEKLVKCQTMLAQPGGDTIQ